MKMKDLSEFEIHNQSIIGKYCTHMYNALVTPHENTDESTADEKLQYVLTVEFFEHYAAEEAREKYPYLNTDECQSQLRALQAFMKDRWPLSKCKKYCNGNYHLHIFWS